MTRPSASFTSMTCGELGQRVLQGAAARFNTFLMLGALALGYGFFSGTSHGVALAWILGGFFIPIAVWLKLKQPGLPLIALIAIQTLLIFATPIVAGNPSLELYSADEVRQAAVEIFFFCVSLTLFWRFGFGADRTPRQPTHYWALSLVSNASPQTVCRLALTLLGANTLYRLAQVTGFLDLLLGELPFGLYPVIRTISDTTALAGCLLGGYAVGTKAMPPTQRLGFWALLVLYCLMKISSILLSTTAGVLVATVLGYFLGASRPPWIFIGLTVAALFFLNLSKFEMRAKYWNEYGYGAGVTLAELPAYFSEWGGYSLDILALNRKISANDEASGQMLSDRLNNLQNLLFAQSAIQQHSAPLLYGETYQLIPKLLIPRFLWPDKPRTHEGQVLLNVHFGRQDLKASFTTNIAWGLLAEAYGNFGSLWGSIICGMFLGFAAGRIEHWIRPYPITSLQAFFFLILSVYFTLSFEMVASVWITSVFQMLVAFLLCVSPLALRRPFDR